MLRAMIVAQENEADKIAATLQSIGVEVVRPYNWDHAIVILERERDNKERSTNFIIYSTSGLVKMGVREFRNRARTVQPDVLVFAVGPKWPSFGPPHGADYYFDGKVEKSVLEAVLTHMVPDPEAEQHRKTNSEAA